MKYAVNEQLAFVNPGFSPCAPCQPPCAPPCPPSVYRSLWELLCQQLFGFIPPGMDPEDHFPSVKIWTCGIEKVSEDNGVFSFTIEAPEEVDRPKAGDVLFYKGVTYIIGDVDY